MTHQVVSRDEWLKARLDLLEAADRGMWAEPEADTINGLRQVLLETEGDLEG